LAAETEEGRQALHLTDRNGEVKKVLAQVDGTVSFGWSPDGEWIAYLIDDPDSETQTDQLLVVIDQDKPDEVIEIRDGLAVAFFWSPDSRKLAYFIPQLVPPGDGESGTAGEPQLFLTVKVLDVKRGESNQVAVFRPSTQFVNLLPFFDQYQHSLTIWSPDSQNMVFSAIDAQGEEGIFIVQSAANLEPRYIAAGEMAAWSWK
jgi:Tol biopolymer transport system component